MKNHNGQSSALSVYAVVLGDIVNSRQTQDRAEVQQRLNRTLSEANRLFRESIAADFSITLGDEFEGLLSSPGSLLKTIDFIRFAMAPHRIRIGIGIGAVTTGIDHKNVIQSDGPAFYLARESIQKIRLYEKKNERPRQDIVLASDLCQADIEILNCCLALSSVIEASWNEEVRKTVGLMLYSGLSQKEGAKKLGISPSGMQRRLKNADYFTFKYAREVMQRKLEGLIAP